MPNQNVRHCGCVLPTLRNGLFIGVPSPRKLTVVIPKPKSGKPDGRPAKKQQLQEDARASKNRSFETGSSSSVAEQARPVNKSSIREKRLMRRGEARRARSADRAESHYTYIDCGSCIVGGGIRESVIPEALYATIPDTPNASANETGNSQLNAQSRSQPVYAVPSMVSPPPTYDVAISKTWQSGLPPTYEEYLCHAKHAMITRSHTPPPPWSDTTTTTPAMLNVQTRREMLASQPELREHLAQLSISQNSERPNAGHHRHNYQGDNSHISNQQASREHQVKMQRTRDSMPPRSQSASRVQQQRIATMYDDGAFCMETTALLSAFENAGCSLM